MRKTNIIDDLILEMRLDVDDKTLIEKVESLENIDLPDSGGMTLLSAACIYDRLEIAKKLIELNANVNVQYEKANNFTALHAAVANGKIDAVKLLLLNHANPNLQDKWGNIALLRAKSYDLEIIKLLLKYGSDCNLQNFYGNSSYNAFAAFPEVIKLLNGEE